MRLLLTGIIAMGTLGACVAPATCRAEPRFSGALELARPIGDTYNERTTDGDAYPQALGVRALLARGDVVVWFDYRRNVYRTESREAGSLTQYARLEGGTGTAVPFLARESAFEARVERRLGARAFSVGLGVVRTWTNYHYPVLTGIGAGLELRPESAAGVRAFGSAYFYPSAAGRYQTESSPSRTLAPAFGIVKLDGGFIVRSARSRIYGIVGYGFEQRSGHGLPADVRFIRSDPYAAIGMRL